MFHYMRLLAVFGVFFLSFSAAAESQADINQIKPSAEQGDALAQAKMGAIYHLGQGVLQDHAEAARWMQKAADQNFIEAMVVMAAFYDVGLGVGRDAGQSTAWYQKAADLGHEPSKGILNYYKGIERAMKATRIASQYSKEILRKK